MRSVTVSWQNALVAVATAALLGLVCASVRAGAEEKPRPDKPVVAVGLLFAKATDDDLAALKGLTILERLDLGRTKITNSGLAALEGMKNLKSLNLAGTKITDGGLSHLKNLAELRRLNVGKLITDAGLEHLQGLVNMESLDIAGNKITSRKVGALVNSITKRSTPKPQPAAGGIPYSRASIKS